MPVELPCEPDLHLQVVLLPKGHEFLREFKQIAGAWHAQLVSGLSASELRQAEELLQRLVDNTSTLLEMGCEGAAC